MEPLIRSWLKAAVSAACETMFPINPQNIPDWQQTNTPARVLAYFEALPPRQRHQFYLLFCALEWLGPVYLPRLSRFSRLSPALRFELLNRWATSPYWPLQLLTDAIKGTLGMVYMSHDAVYAHIGITQGCARPWDTLKPPTDATQLSNPLHLQAAP